MLVLGSGASSARSAPPFSCCREKGGRGDEGSRRAAPPVIGELPRYLHLTPAFATTSAGMAARDLQPLTAHSAVEGDGDGGRIRTAKQEGRMQGYARDYDNGGRNWIERAGETVRGWFGAGGDYDRDYGYGGNA